MNDSYPDFNNDVIWPYDTFYSSETCDQMFAVLLTGDFAVTTSNLMMLFMSPIAFMEVL